MANDHNDTERDGAGRFRRGAASPNPKGRPRKSKGVNDALLKAVSEKVTVTEQGKRKRKSKLEITAAQLANKGAGGDPRAAKLLLDQTRKAEEDAEANSGQAPVMTRTDREIVELVVARIAEAIKQGGSDASEA